MLGLEIILVVINLAMACDTSARLKKLEIEVHYGTYPSEAFPDDPRHKPQGFFDMCGW